MSLEHDADQHGDIYNHGPRCERCGHELETGAVPCCDDATGRGDEMIFTIEVMGPDGWVEAELPGGRSMVWDDLGSAEDCAQALHRDTDGRYGIRIIATPSFRLTEGDRAVRR